MKTHEEIEAICEKLGFKIKGSKNSFKALHKHIKDDENIIHLLDTSLELLVVTDKRILILKSSWGNTDVKDFILKNIASVDVDAGTFMTDIIIRTAAHTDKIRVADKQSGYDFRAKAIEAIEKSTTVQSTSGTIDIATQLEKLASLREKGILTDAEFSEQKQKLLSQS